MTEVSNFESAAARLATLSTGGGHDLKGRISRESLVRLDFDDGSTIIAPEAVMMQKGTIDTVGDIVDIFCKLTGRCGGGGGGGGGGPVCYKTIISPDGTITITPVPCPKKA
jgi:hypothetical protein